MLADLVPLFRRLNVVLASGSPRRKEILTQLGLRFRIMKSAFLEDLDKSKYTPETYCQTTSEQKAIDVWRQLPPGTCDLLVGSDTVVVSADDEIMEKPKDQSGAVDMLSGLSGKTHRVVSSISIVSPIGGICDIGEAADVKGALGSASGGVVRTQRLEPQAAAEDPLPVASGGASTGPSGPLTTPPGMLQSWTCSTKVTFDDIPRSTIEAYVATGEPMDKAGGYGIQGLGGSFVSSISGCYYTVMGFPMHSFAARLRALALAWPEARRPPHAIEGKPAPGAGSKDAPPAVAATATATEGEGTGPAAGGAGGT